MKKAALKELIWKKIPIISPILIKELPLSNRGESVSLSSLD